MTNRDIILASASPRRKELLERLGLEFEIRPSGLNENKINAASPEELVTKIAVAKAKKVALDETKALIIAADTVVIYQGEILGKPDDKNSARKMLNKLSNDTHQVMTGYALLDCRNNQLASGYDKTEVQMRQLTEQEILAYIDTNEPLDKAGAYGIQGLGGILVKKINGSHSNVVGLPLTTLTLKLKQFSINIL